MAGSFVMDDGDLPIVRALQLDPRVPFTTVASVLGVSEPTVSRRWALLRRTGAGSA